MIACDCGVVVKPRVVETQLDGGMSYRLSAALFGEITVKNGQGNFDTAQERRLRRKKRGDPAEAAGWLE